MPRLIRKENGDVVGMTAPALQLVLAAVQCVQSAQLKYPAQGVCSNVDYHTREHDICGYDAMQFLAQDWPHARRTLGGAVQEYFIPAVAGVGMWGGPNWRMRHDFMAHAIKRLEDMLKAQEGTDA